MKRDYPRLDWPSFGEKLLDSGDLDPLYYLNQLNVDKSQLKRILLAYWCYYSAGVSCWVSSHSSGEFYEKMREVYKTAPRGHERRHFRGENGWKAINELESFGPPEDVVDHMTCASNPNRKVTDVIRATTRHYQFGPWIAWKVADMTERVLGLSVDFRHANLLMYEEPTKAVGLILYGDSNSKIVKGDVNYLVGKMLEFYREKKAPPDLDREINIQEIETILCKFKAHINGFYPLGLDTHEVIEGLENWGETASQLRSIILKNTLELQGV